LVLRQVEGPAAAFGQLPAATTTKLLTAVQNGGAGEVSRRFNLAAHMSAVL
jgi:hypothetical protein